MEDAELIEDEKIIYGITMKLYDNLPKYIYNVF